MISMPKLTIHCGYNLIGHANDYAEAEKICREYCVNEGRTANGRITFQKVFDTFADGDQTFVLAYQFRTLYILTFFITDKIVLPSAEEAENVPSCKGCAHCGWDLNEMICHKHQFVCPDWMARNNG